jgi:hypothetical protein
VPTAAKTTIARTSSARASASNTSPSFTTAPKVSFPFVAGIVTGSVSLVGFGLDSVIEVFSGAALLWRLHHDLNAIRREQVERITLRGVDSCFVALALYILYESGTTLIGHKTPERSLAGMIHRRRLRGGNAAVGTSETEGRCRNWKRSHDRRFQTGRFLHIPVGDSVERLYC